MPAGRMHDAWEAGARIAQIFGDATEGFDLFLCPTTAVPAIPADHDQSRDELRIGGETVDPTLGWVLTHPFNMMSSRPVLAVPSGLAPVPTGVQIVGRPWRDDDVFRAGLVLEAAAGGWIGASTGPPALPDADPTDTLGRPIDRGGTSP